MSADGLVIRDARSDEREAMARLTMAAYAPYATIMAPDAWAGLEGAVRAALATDLPAQRIVAERDGRLVGSVMLFPPATDAYGAMAGQVTWPELRLLAVADEARGSGVGEALVRECVARARAAGATVLGLHTSRSMQPAMRLYARLGFVRAPEDDFQPEGAELVEGYRLAL